MNTVYVVAGTVMLLIGIAVAVWGQNTATECKSFTGSLRQLATNDRAQCEYTDAALGIGITFAVLGLIIAIIAVNTKEQEEQTTY
jgi:uncharacterized membrane protein